VIWGGLAHLPCHSSRLEARWERPFLDSAMELDPLDKAFEVTHTALQDPNRLLALLHVLLCFAEVVDFINRPVEVVEEEVPAGLL